MTMEKKPAMPSLEMYQYQRLILFAFLLVLISIQEGFNVFCPALHHYDNNNSSTTDDNGNINNNGMHINGVYTHDDHQQYQSLRYLRRRSATSSTHNNTKVVAAKTPRIVGGIDAKGNVPYFISWGGCGATLIYNDIALSAAHCSKRDDAQVGPKYRNSWTRVDEVRKHPQYDSESYNYDFAVLKLKGWFQDDTVQLNTNNESPQVGESLTILGFGGQLDILKEGTVESISPSICAQQWLRAGYSIDESAILCAKGDDGVDACTGDSGGPLLLADSSIQVGVISSGSGCDGRLPTVYSRISAGEDWIRQQICELSEFPPKFCNVINNRRDEEEKTLRIDINLDDYPQDIRWKITKPTSDDGGSSNDDDGSGETVASSNNFQIANSLESMFINLPNNSNYVFTIEDVGGFADGLGKNGGFKVVTVKKDGNDENTLVSGRGNDFQDSLSTKFSIGTVPKPTLAPIAKPTLSRPILSQMNSNQNPPPTSFPTESWMVSMENRPFGSTPALYPTAAPISTATQNPTENATNKLTNSATKRPTTQPSILFQNPTAVPTITKETTDEPTSLPTPYSTKEETKEPSQKQTEFPTNRPTEPSTKESTGFPTNAATDSSTKEPTGYPTTEPTGFPTNAATESPTETDLFPEERSIEEEYDNDDNNDDDVDDDDDGFLTGY